MNYNHYIPRPDRKFLAWANNFLKYLMSRLTKFKFPQEVYDRLEQKKNVLAQKLEVAEEPATRTPVNVAGKNAAREDLETDIRHAVAEYLIHNHLLTAEDLTMLGLPIHDTKPSPAPAITSRPIVEVNFEEIQKHILIVRDAEIESTGKPAHVAGFEIWRKVGEPAPVADSDWELAGQAPHSPHELNYNGTETGLRVYYRVRWINTRGVPGPWSETVNAVIP
jgi:hypothetical protein